MSEHRATDEQIEAMREARRRLEEATTNAVEAAKAFQQAVQAVLYGSQGAPKGSAYELSNDLARQHWPTPPPPPGG
ncbi:hypothetical protein [Streptomyces microflavus]|nr:hypothetical protein [Streptomyces microflavus]